MIEQIFSNWICWSILGLALVCYQLLWVEFFTMKSNASDYIEPEVSNTALTNILIGALPLLGLLGTIVGLLKCFAGIASDGASGALLSGGIADALLTTQLGLVCAIPGWLLQAYIRSMVREHNLSAIPG